jgi:hypothetical protein
LYASIGKSTPSAISSNNAAFAAALAAAEDVLRGQHIFSTEARLALIDPAPPLTEPYLFTYLRRLGKFDGQPIMDRLRDAEYDVVITYPSSWRGLESTPLDLQQLIASSYTPKCKIFDSVLHLPKNRPVNVVLLRKLNRVGCAPLSATDTN